MCPICMNAIAATEGDVLTHVLRRHPAEAKGLGLVLTLANLALASRPAWLLSFDLVVLGLGLWLAYGYQQP